MKKIIVLFQFLYIVLSNGIYCQQYINSDTTWLADTLIINNDILIGKNARLTIKPGKTIIFENYSGIEIKGRLSAIGAQFDSIMFIVSDTTDFTDTASLNGGWKGLHFYDNYNSDTSFLTYCRISNGKASGQKSFFGNILVANKGGGIIINNYNNIFIDNSLIINNYATFKGAGVYIKSSDNVIISNCLIKNNMTYSMGGGIYSLGGSVGIVDNIFDFNIAFEIDTVGGYIWYNGTGSSIYTSLGSNNYPIIKNNFLNRSKGASGVLYDNNFSSQITDNIIINNNDIGFFNGHSGSHTSFYNNIVSNNYVSTPTHSGLVIFSKFLPIINCVIWGNIAGWLEEPPQIKDFGEDLDVEYNCVQYGYPGEGNISANPQFANPTEGAGIDYDGLAADWTLLETSPCINTGTPDTTGLNLPEFDLAGSPRVFGGRIDMGAYENQSVYVKINESSVFSKIKLYPNPGSDKIYIDIPPEINGSWIDIVDGQGKVLMHKQIQMSPAVLSPYKLKSGIYYYRIYTENEVVKSGKWVKTAKR